MNEQLTIIDKLKRLDIVNNSNYCNGDLGAGRLFAEIWGHKARYIPERRQWYVYDGKQWVEDIDNLAVSEYAKKIADALLLFLPTIQGEQQRASFLKICSNWSNYTHRNKYILEARSICPTSIREFDKEPHLLNCLNCTIDLRSMEPHEHTSEDWLTQNTNVTYVPDATSPRFARFIDEVTGYDKELACFLQRALGYGISGYTRHECLFVLYGPSTRNGKGVLMESCLSVVGAYGRAVRPETIAYRKNANSQAPSEDIARLKGIRFANISEPGNCLVLNAAQVKTMTGNDTINARFLHENSFDFRGQFKIYINTNHLPIITDMTLFQSGRVHIIPFLRHFEACEQDPTLKEEFSTPQSKSAILNWLLEGYRMLCTEGLNPPKAVIDATRSYYRDSDTIGHFMEEMLVAEAQAEIRTSHLYDTYRAWCEENGARVETQTQLMARLRQTMHVARQRPKTGGEKTTLLLGYRIMGDDTSSAE